MLLSLVFLIVGCENHSDPSEQEPANKGPFHVHPGEDIQQALDQASRANENRRVIVHAGTYSPPLPAFAFLVLTSRHDGVELIAEGDVTLSARSEPSTPATSPSLVNHVIYCGDGLSSKTLIEGFTITGANGFVTQDRIPQERFGMREETLQRGTFFLLDGGGLKVFGQSSPTIRNVRFIENCTDLCGGAVSIEQQGFNEVAVSFENCLFQGNRCPGTGSAIDVLSGSSARITNCLFVGNIANFGMEQISRDFGLTYNEQHGCGALTVFPGSRVFVTSSTFTENWNGIDDHGQGSQYEQCLLWNNTATDGSRPGKPYEVDILDGSGVKDCWIHGEINDLRGTVNQEWNRFAPPDPEFDSDFIPRNPDYVDVGYRPPVSTPSKDELLN
ncbi:MAG: right-handed parallel beta-helix repeat-containing protein [Planctomycetaceae bacterium]|nr:right-handed parallel beta-helix repeat-containing protein [Planctomycetaceae bacterium]